MLEVPQLSAQGMHWTCRILCQCSPLLMIHNWSSKLACLSNQMHWLLWEAANSLEASDPNVATEFLRAI